jgi:hypothetical protein
MFRHKKGALKVWAAVLFMGCAAVLFMGCASVKPGVLIVRGIPENYSLGVILVSGENKQGETFTYSPKTFQRIPGGTAEINIYSEAAMTQKPFGGSGEYTVTVALYEAGDPGKSETRRFVKTFSSGGAVLRWDE